jgi:hypothetical protein
MNTCGHSPYITYCLTRRWVCHLQLLLALASAFILASESRETRDHILFSPDSRLHFLSPPTTRSATVEVFDTTSTRERIVYDIQSYRKNCGFFITIISWRCMGHICSFCMIIMLTSWEKDLYQQEQNISYMRRNACLIYNIKVNNR